VSVLREQVQRLRWRYRLLVMPLGSHRAFWLVVAGAALLVLAAARPWTLHPTAVAIVGAGELQLREQTFAVDQMLRAVIGAVGLVYLAALTRLIAPRRWQRWLVWLLPAVLLAYPAWVTQLSPGRMSERSLLYHEMNRVARDMDANLTGQQVDWRAWQRLSRETVRDTPALDAAEPWSLATFSPTQVQRLPEELLGLSDEFLGLLRPTPLVLALAGLVMLIYGLHRGFKGTWGDLGRGLMLAGGVAAVLLAWPVGSRLAAEAHVAGHEEALRRGDSRAAVEHLHAAAALHPRLASAWYHQARLGRLAQQQDRHDTPDALLARAYALLSAREPRAALVQIERAQRLFPEQAEALSRPLALALSEAGIEAFNRGQNSLAAEHWQASLQLLPINPMPWYGLSLAHLRQQRFDDAARCLEQLALLQRYLGYRRLVVRSQAVVVQSWAALQRGDRAAAHALYSRSLHPEGW
jgi:tetratricopeptide (TPR) repeat protein